MAERKKIRFVKRIKDHEDTDLKDNSREGNGDNPERSIEDKLNTSLSAMDDKLIHKFFNDILRIVDVDNFADASRCIKEKFPTELKKVFIYKELMEFLGVTKEKREKDQSQNSDVPENPEDNPDGSSPENQAGGPEFNFDFDFDFNNEQDKPELPDGDKNPFELPEEVKDKFEEFARDSFESIKRKLNEELDRLTVCEARLDNHDTELKDSKNMIIGIGDKVKSTFNGFKDLISKVIEKKFSEGNGGPSANTFTVKYQDKNKKNKKMQGVVPKQFGRLIQLGQSRKNIMMIGPSGCGKTHIAPILAEALDLRFASMSCNEGMNEDIFQGMLLPTGESLKMEYWKSKFVDFYENGGLFLMDELDLADSNLLAFANTALANDYFFLPKRINNPLIKRHKDFVVVANMNTYGHGGNMMYNARNQLDGATLDRFRSGMVEMNYDKRVETSIIDKEVYEWGKWIRKGIDALKMQRLMTTRLMKDFTDMKSEHNWGVKEWEQSYFLDWEKDDEKQLKGWIIKELNVMKSKLENELK